MTTYEDKCNQFNRDRNVQFTQGKQLLAEYDERQRDRTQIERLTAENAALRAQLERQSA